MMRSSVATVSESSGSTACPARRLPASSDAFSALPDARPRPRRPTATVEQSRPPDVLHVPPRVLLAEEVAADTDLLDGIDGERLVVDGDAGDDGGAPRVDLGVGDELMGREDGAAAQRAGARQQGGAGGRGAQRRERAVRAGEPVGSGRRGRERGRGHGKPAVRQHLRGGDDEDRRVRAGRGQPRELRPDGSDEGGARRQRLDGGVRGEHVGEIGGQRSGDVGRRRSPRPAGRGGRARSTRRGGREGDKLRRRQTTPRRPASDSGGRRAVRLIVAQRSRPRSPPPSRPSGMTAGQHDVPRRRAHGGDDLRRCAASPSGRRRHRRPDDHGDLGQRVRQTTRILEVFLRPGARRPSATASA